MTTHRPSRLRLHPAFTIMELIVTVAIVVVLAALTITVVTSMRGEANLVRATEKIKRLGEAFEP